MSISSISSYKDAGVNIDAGNELVKRIKHMVPGTFQSPKRCWDVLSGVGGFSGLFNLDWKRFSEPILVSGCDGVGTKLKISQLVNKHETIGIDLVAMCVNDLLVYGATPLFFLDYLATGKLDVESAEAIISGIVDGCKQAGCALLGGETAEMPGMYPDGEYDLAGFVVGVVDKPLIIDGSKIIEGDVVIGLASSGIHSNGYSLVRKLLSRDEIISMSDTLLTPTKIYHFIPEIAMAIEIKGMAHITGGGFIDNIPRILPAGTGVCIKKGSWHIHEIFNLLQQKGEIPEHEMYRTFNMGIGMVIIVSSFVADEMMQRLQASGEKAFIIGKVVKGEGVSIGF
ncbi:MAG: phosphoribosylformylglycinamidine cyclo-ligase [bacterium]|nr:phosphoribosylformylglycinamidine cyclo-ligase [bacterium]